MNLKLTQNIIKEMCGTVSFKKGDSFYRAHKVQFKKIDPDRCEAVVSGSEDFHVTIEKIETGGFRTKCTCPKLASFHKECQHVAAVLLAIYEQQRQGTLPQVHGEEQASSAIAEGFFKLFNGKPGKSNAQQQHFDKRKILKATFICKPVSLSNRLNLFGIGLKIGQTAIQDLRNFLIKMKKGHPVRITPTFIYDPERHCFQKNTAEVFQELFNVIQDETVYLEGLKEQNEDDGQEQYLLIPPSSWHRLLPLLDKAPAVSLEHGGNFYESLDFSSAPLSLKFDLVESDGKGYQLKIHGLSQMIVLRDYHMVLKEGKLIPLKSEDCERLFQLNQLLEDSGSKEIPISQEQAGIFLDKVVPGLKKLGDVHISEGLAKKLETPPLIAKLYLDRVKNRLLAGLEFCYDHIVINPLESRKSPEGGALLVRDVDKERAILKLMEESSFTKTDAGYFLHNEELEYEFLYNMVPKLQKLVRIYATTAVKNRIFSGNSRPRIRVKVKKERVNWLEFTFRMDGIADKEIRELLAALEEKRKYYRLRSGALLSLEQRDFAAIRKFLNTLPVQYEDLEKGLDLPIVRGLPLLDQVDDNAIFSTSESFQQFLENLNHPGRMKFPVPEELNSVLREYQKTGFHWMKTLASYGFGGILADDMGLGKTLQSIAYMVSELPEINDKRMPALVVCPSSLTYNWLDEFRKFAPHIKAVIIDGNRENRFKLQMQAMERDVVITSYSLLLHDIKWYEKQNFHTVFFDEAQAFKNPLTKTAKAAGKIKALHSFALTGTPIENSLEELWSIFRVVFPELFGGLRDYSKLTKKAVSRRSKPFLLRRVKQDILTELPAKIELVEPAELLPEQKKLYAAYLAKLRQETLKHLDKDTFRKNRLKILAGLTRLRQICCHPALFVAGYKGGSAKFAQLFQITADAKFAGRRVLIFSQFTKMLELIGKELVNQGQSFFYLNGGISAKDRVDMCRRFNAGERDFFLISLKAGGTGLNLTGADTVILYDSWWNPAVEDQAADRAYRIGQSKEVQVIKLIARGTIEEKMNELQARKRHLIKEIIDPGEQMQALLTEEDIRDILMI